jgi:hypothetical protein
MNDGTDSNTGVQRHMSAAHVRQQRHNKGTLQRGMSRARQSEPAKPEICSVRRLAHFAVQQIQQRHYKVTLQEFEQRDREQTG